MGTVFGCVVELIVADLGVIVVLALTIIHMVIAVVGGVIGSAIRGETIYTESY